jgi:LPXTG-motif cell wall-anchored protein
MKKFTQPRRALKLAVPAAAAAAIVLGSSGSAGAYPPDPGGETGGGGDETSVGGDVGGDTGTLPATGGDGVSQTMTIAGVTVLVGAGLLGAGTLRRRSAADA